MEAESEEEWTVTENTGNKVVIQLGNKTKSHSQGHWISKEDFLAWFPVGSLVYPSALKDLLKRH
jgi:hypothetical protein